MRVVSTKMLREYCLKAPENAYAQGPLSAWLKMVNSVVWKTPMDVKGTFGNASIRPSGRVVFNCAGNKLRIVAGIHYSAGVVYVKFVGSHPEYDVVDVDTVDQSK